MTFFIANPPVTTLAFHVGARSNTDTGNYNKDLADWVGNDLGRMKIADQILGQGGARAKLLRLEDLSVHDEAPPLPPQVDTIILSFTSTSQSIIHDIISTLIEQALESVPAEFKLQIFYDFSYSMARAEAVSMIQHIQSRLLDNGNSNISLKPVDESASSTASANPELAHRVVGTPDDFLDIDSDSDEDIDDAELSAQIEGYGCDSMEDQIEGDRPPAENPEVNYPPTTSPINPKPVQRKENDINAEKNAPPAELVGEPDVGEDEFEPGLPRQAALAVRAEGEAGESSGVSS